MRRVIFRERERIELVDSQLSPLRDGEVHITATRSLISPGTELTCLLRGFERNSSWDKWVRYPFAPGYSLVGIAQNSSTEIPEGTRIATRAPHQSEAAVTVDNVFPIPNVLGDEEAVWFAIAAIAARASIRANHRTGDTAAVVGLGPLGQLVIQYAIVHGARKVLSIGSNSFRQEAALISGATPVMLPIELADGALGDSAFDGGVDVLYDVTGNPHVLSHALRLVRPFGTVVLVGDTGYPSMQRLSSDLLQKGLIIVGIHDGHVKGFANNQELPTRRDLAVAFFNHLMDGCIKVRHLITHHFSPWQAEAAYTTARDHRVSIGVIFEWT